MKKKCLLVAVIIMALLASTVSAFAADPAVTIVNPAATVYTDNLLISVKLTQPKTIKVRVTELMQVKSDGTKVHITSTVDKTKGKIVEEARLNGAAFTGSGSLSYYTTQINGIQPGVYKIYVDTLGNGGAVVNTTEKKCMVLDKKESQEKASDEDQSGVMKFFQNVLNSIFN